MRDDMDRTLIKEFWNCGDNEIIQFAIIRAHLNRLESDVLHCMLDLCYTQEETAEKLCYSVRKVQELWYSATDKILRIPWVFAYSIELRNKN